MKENLIITVAFTLDTDSWSNIGFYFNLKSRQIQLEESQAFQIQKEAYRKIAEKLESKTFHDHISVREHWFKEQIASAENAVKLIYQEAESLLKHARFD